MNGETAKGAQGLAAVEVRELTLREDQRGWLMEILRAEQVQTKSFGQLYLTTANPNQKKGGHYHQRKTEWFCVIKGEGRLVLEDIQTREVMELFMGENRRLTVKIPPGVAHVIYNVGNEMMFLLAYIDESFSPLDPDTVPYLPRVQEPAS